MTPGRYTELFFLDEATALSAGHRPCAECCAHDTTSSAAAWAAGNPQALGSGRLSAESIDDVLHADRMAPDGSKHTFTAQLDQLPDGVLVALDGRPDQALLIQGRCLLVWSPGGYCERLPRPEGGRVSVLTPESTAAAIRAGFVPQVHATASRG